MQSHRPQAKPAFAAIPTALCLLCVPLKAAAPADSQPASDDAKKHCATDAALASNDPKQIDKAIQCVQSYKEKQNELKAAQNRLKLALGEPDAATPTFDPAAGTYSAAQTVTIKDTTSGAKIYYTIDGSAPTTTSIRYTDPIPIKVGTTLRDRKSTRLNS